MNIVYAFIGPLPPYSIDTVHQTRLFFDGPLYFIVSDLSSAYVPILEDTYRVTIVPYESVKDEGFQAMIEENIDKFPDISGLGTRSKLMIYGFERFFVLNQLMKQKGLRDVFFMELDNLIYNDPVQWLSGFRQAEMAYMFDDGGRASAGIAYIKDTTILEHFLNYCATFIQEDTQNVMKNALQEMVVLYYFWQENTQRVQLLPILWPSDAKGDGTDFLQASHTYPLYDSLFDAASLGICVGGLDPYHTGGPLIKNIKGPWSMFDYSGYRLEWQPDSKERHIPYLWSETRKSWIRINNLHIHSKELALYVSRGPSKDSGFGGLECARASGPAHPF
jgi:hypothetical protein